MNYWKKTSASNKHYLIPSVLNLILDGSSTFKSSSLPRPFPQSHFPFLPFPDETNWFYVFESKRRFLPGFFFWVKSAFIYGIRNVADGFYKNQIHVSLDQSRCANGCLRHLHPQHKQKLAAIFWTWCFCFSFDWFCVFSIFEWSKSKFTKKQQKLILVRPLDWIMWERMILFPRGMSLSNSLVVIDVDTIPLQNEIHNSLLLPLPSFKLWSFKF